MPPTDKRSAVCVPFTDQFRYESELIAVHIAFEESAPDFVDSFVSYKTLHSSLGCFPILLLLLGLKTQNNITTIGS